MAFTGCTLCQDCGDLDYPTYGGAWERTRRDSGRVGSVFDPAGARTARLSSREPQQDDPVSGQPGEPIESGAPEGLEAGSGDPPSGSSNRQNGTNPVPSPSDRDPGNRRQDESGSMRELDLEDIDVQLQDAPPPNLR